MAELEDFEGVPSLALFSFPDLLQRGATMGPFDNVKKIDVMNFEWIVIIRDFQTPRRAS
jgi:hypothetical protein